MIYLLLYLHIICTFIKGGLTVWLKLQDVPRHCIWMSLSNISICQILHLSKSCRNVSLSPPAEPLSPVDFLDCEIIPYKHDRDVINGKYVWSLLFPRHFYQMFSMIHNHVTQIQLQPQKKPSISFVVRL